MDEVEAVVTEAMRIESRSSQEGLPSKVEISHRMGLGSNISLLPGP